MCLLYSIFQHECAFETIVCTNFIFICMKNTVRMQRILLECSVTSLVCVCYFCVTEKTLCRIAFKVASL